MRLKLGLMDGNILFIDGTKVRANASIKNTWSQKRIDEMLKKVDRKIEAFLRESEQIDDQEEWEASLLQLQKDLHMVFINTENWRERFSQMAAECGMPGDSDGAIVKVREYYLSIFGKS